MVARLVVGRGRCGRGLDVGVARATSAAGSRVPRRDGQRRRPGRVAAVEGQLAGRRSPRRPGPRRPGHDRSWPWRGPAWSQTRRARGLRPLVSGRDPRPAPGQVQFPVDQGVPSIGGVDAAAPLAAQHERPGRRRGSTRPNRPATRPSNSSSPTCQQAGSTARLWSAATV
jgi:hypothetical protein